MTIYTEPFISQYFHHSNSCFPYLLVKLVFSNIIKFTYTLRQYVYIYIYVCMCVSNISNICLYSQTLTALSMWSISVSYTNSWDLYKYKFICLPMYIWTSTFVCSCERQRQQNRLKNISTFLIVIKMKTRFWLRPSKYIGRAQSYIWTIRNGEYLW